MKRSTGNTRERAAGTNRLDRAGVRVDSVARGSVAERAGIVAGDRILFVAGETVGDLLDLHFLTSRRRFRLRWATAQGEEKESVIRTGGDPLGVLPEPVHLLLRPPAAEGDAQEPLRQGRGRPAILFARTICDILRHFRRGDPEDSALPPVPPVRLHPHDRPRSAQADARQSPRGRRHGSHAPVRFRRHHSPRPDRRVPGDQRRGGACAVAQRAFRDSARAIHRRRGAGGAYLPPAWASSLASGHPRRGEGDACHARAAAPPPGGPGGGTLRRGRRRILPDGGGTNPRAPRVRIVRADRQRGGIAAELSGRLARALPAEEVEEVGCGGHGGQRPLSPLLRFRFLEGILPKGGGAVRPPAGYESSHGEKRDGDGASRGGGYPVRLEREKGFEDLYPLRVSPGRGRPLP